VLKAVSSALRLQILILLFDRGSLSYTELMGSLKMNPSRDAGRFAYHLKFLLKADLVEADVETRKYLLTELGKMVIEVADRVEKRASKPKGMLVRASRLALEEFDVNRIANSLIHEAKMPADLAQKVSKEAESRLIKSKTKYLTAPLVREMVNAILVEKGLEEYRHKLTRLGLPVYEVSMLIESKSKNLQDSSSVREAAGEAVLNEYTLLNVFPRDIADAHLSGAIHIDGLDSWILKPSEVIHDLRFFFKNGLSTEKLSVLRSHSPPRNMESALFTVLNVILHSAREVSGAQMLPYFNLFLAPFTREADQTRIKETLRSFILSLGQLSNASISLELTVPKFIDNKSATGPFGKPCGKYEDFQQETQQLASAILDILSEESTTVPLFSPKVIVAVRSEIFSNERAKALFLKAHRLASEKGLVYFAYLRREGQTQAVYSGSGCRFDTDLNSDWQTDTMRTGCLGIVAVNLPRIVYECANDKAKFLDLLRERLELAARALDIKYATLKKDEDLLPFLEQNCEGDRYYNLDTSSRLISLIGVKEAVEAFSGKNAHQDEKASQFLDEIIACSFDFLHKASRKRGKRLLPALLSSNEAPKRLAQLDIDRFGLGKVKHTGTREKPVYTSVSGLLVKNGQIPTELLAAEQKLDRLRAGGSLCMVELGSDEYTPDNLASLSQQIFEQGKIEFFTYDRKFTFCTKCKKSWFGVLHKCPVCGAVGTLRVCDRFAVKEA
jgi:ribonucleoside-triphosphate reductase